MAVSVGNWTRYSVADAAQWEWSFTHSHVAGPSLLIIVAGQQRDTVPPLAEPTTKLDGATLIPAAGTFHHDGSSSFNSQPNFTVYFQGAVAPGDRAIAVAFDPARTRSLIAWAIELSGVDVGNPIAASALGNNGWVSDPNVDLTTVQDGSLVVAMMGLRGGDTAPLSVVSPAGLILGDDHTPDPANGSALHAAWAHIQNPSAATERYQLHSALADYATAAAIEIRAAAASVRRRRTLQIIM